MKQVEVYTDGACSGNPGPGGWGAILRFQGIEKEIAGFERETTNNRMELTAAIQGLSRLKEPCQVDLYTDSQYLSKAINEGWLQNWKKKGWVKSDKKPVLNVELWQALDEQLRRHQSDHPLGQRSRGQPIQQPMRCSGHWPDCPKSLAQSSV